MPIPMSIVWLAVTVLLAIIEAATVALTAIWFAVGALLAMIAALFGANLVVQIVLFLAGSGAMLYFTRPLALKYFSSATRTKTNADRVVSMNGIVTLCIDNTKAQGQVRITNGQIWTARSENDEIIEENAEVVVKSIAGVKVIVEKIKHTGGEK